MSGRLALPDGELTLLGRITTASNATFVGTIDGVRVVYKPVAGERPLWDFPGATLATREVATYLVSEALGWDVVPPTWVREGPHGPGMVQLWREPDPEQEAVTVVAARAVPDGLLHVVDGLGADGEPVALVHEDSVALRRIAVLDVLVNNADRKGGHVLEMPGGHRHGCDHGLTFHVEPKLRTVLWGWVGQPLLAEEVDTVRRVRELVDGPLGTALTSLVDDDEVAALADRCDVLTSRGEFPAPAGDMPAVPWPPF